MIKLIFILSILMFIGAYFVSSFPMTNDSDWQSAISILVLFLPLFFALYRWLGLNKTFLVLGILGLFALIFEAQAVITGWPYGAFTYHQQIGFKVFDIVPWTVPFAWLPLAIGSMAISYQLTKKVVYRILIASLIMVWADLVIDPGAVGLGFWSYLEGGNYYQVPFTNYFGWIISSLIAQTWLWLLLRKNINKIPAAELSLSFYLILTFWSSINWWLGHLPVVLVGIILLTLIIKTVYLAKTVSVS